MSVCTIPPPGWVCTRERGHDGPCAAYPDPRIVELFPPGSIENDMDAQLIALALVRLAAERPGWKWALQDLADRHQLRPLFNAFLETSAEPN